METIRREGLEEHLTERVFIGKDEDSMWRKLTSNAGSGNMGILLKDWKRGTFYIILHKKRDKKTNTEVNAPWTETTEEYVPKTGDVIGILYGNGWRPCEINL